MEEHKLVERKEYLDFLVRSMNKQIIKVVSGVRRSGKSTLFSLFKKQLLKEGIEEKQIISLNFEYLENEALLDYKTLHQYVLGNIIADEINYVFLDEIQNVENFEKVVDSLFLRKNIDLYITGSNAYFLSGELATLLSGRYVELKMLPLSFKEYRTWHLQNEMEVNDNVLFDSYLKGSLPYLLNIESDEERLDYLNGIYSTVVLYDIVKRLNVKDVRVLERLIETMFSTIGSLITINKLKNTIISKQIKITNPTVDRYIKGIIDSLLMYEAKRYNIQGKMLLDTQAKYYVVDIGLRQLILRDHFEDFGHIIENVVYLELLRRNNTVYVGDNEGKEVDFVAINANKEIAYYQVALSTLDSNTLERELGSLQNINDNYPKYLLTMDTFNKEANYDGIKKINVIDWLLEEIK